MSKNGGLISQITQALPKGNSNQSTEVRNSQSENLVRMGSDKKLKKQLWS